MSNSYLLSPNNLNLHSNDMNVAGDLEVSGTSSLERLVLSATTSGQGTLSAAGTLTTPALVGQQWTPGSFVLCVYRDGGVAPADQIYGSISVTDDSFVITGTPGAFVSWVIVGDVVDV